MKGADEYARLFPVAEKHGKLLLEPGGHARGKTFHVYVLPENCVPIYGDYGGVSYLKSYNYNNVVEVYGIISGQPGWTEEYGWIHEGPWQKDFYDLVEQRKKDLEEKKRQKEEIEQQQEESKQQKIKQLLSNY